MVNKHFVCLWLHFCLPNKAAQQQRNSEQCLIPSARTENARWTLGTLTQTGAAPQQPPLSPQWKKVLLRSPHTAASDYAHSWWAQLPVLQQGDPAKPTGKGATLVPLRKRSSYWGGEKKIQIPLKSTTPISVATPWIKIPRTASTSIGKLCFYNGCSVNIRKTSLATKDSTIYLIKHFLPILIVFGSWNLCKKEAIQRKAAWAAPSKTFAYLGSLKKNKISILYTF